MHAVFPKAQEERRGALPAEEFDFLRRIASYEGLSEILLRKESFDLCTKDSLCLLNESFSTTSFEEGYYIAKDSVKALQKKSVRTIYNTHMYKLGNDIEELNRENTDAQISSLIVRSENGNRSFEIEVAPPEGRSYARDIAEKYGVTYEMLTSGM